MNLWRNFSIACFCYIKVSQWQVDEVSGTNLFDEREEMSCCVLERLLVIGMFAD